MRQLILNLIALERSGHSRKGSERQNAEWGEVGGLLLTPPN